VQPLDHLAKNGRFELDRHRHQGLHRSGIGLLRQNHKARIPALLARNIAAFQRLAKCAPSLAGPEFTVGDCAAYVGLPLVAMASKIIYGADALQAAGIDWKGYIKLIEQRPSAQRVTACRRVGRRIRRQH